MNSPIELKGVINGKTITLDDETFLPAGYRVTLHLILTPEETLDVVSEGWGDMTAEEIADCEQMMSEFLGYPFKMPDVGSP